MTTPSNGEEHVRLRLGLYVLDALSPDEFAAVESHLADCAGCRTEAFELGEVREFLDLLTLSDVDALPAERVAADGLAPEPVATLPVTAAAPRSRARPQPRAGSVTMPATEPADTTASGPPASRPAAHSAPSRPAPSHPAPSDPAPAGSGSGLTGSSPGSSGPSGSGPTGSGPGRSGPAGTGPQGRPGSRRRRVHPYRLLLSAVALALAAGVGIGVWLNASSPVGITLAGSETNAVTGVSLSVTVVGSDRGSHVDAEVKGLKPGVTYQLYAVSARGDTQVVARWIGSGATQTTAGDIAIRAEDLAFVTVTQADGSVLITVRVARSNAPK